jgi:outer membrane protein assembly factor BamB
MRYTFVALAWLGMALASAQTFGQSRLGGLISSDVAHRHGLDLAWSTQVHVSRSNGRVTHINQHVSEWVYLEVKLGDLSWKYSERDRDARGIQIGRSGAAELADARMRDLAEHHLKPTLTTHVMADVNLFVVTNRGILQSIDGETGQTLWTQQIGNSDYPTTAASANDAYVAICNGSTIYMLDRKTGDMLWNRDARYTISAGPVVTKDIVAVPTIRGAVEAYKVSQAKRSVPHIYKSQGHVYMQPIATPRSIVWATETGHMYVADGTSGVARFRLETSGAIVGQPAYLAPRYIFATSVDGYLYCCDESRGDMLWRYSTGSTISQGPVAVGETVYIVTDTGELHAVDYKSGLLKPTKSREELEQEAKPDAIAKKKDSGPVRRWPVVSGIRGIVSVSPTRIYCLGRSNQLIAIDNNSGSILGTMSIGGQDIVLHNAVTDRLVLGTSTGILQCLHEAKLTVPYVHEIEIEKQKSKRPDVIVDAGDNALDKPKEEAPVGDPFGGGAKPADDPFGAGGEKPEKPAKPADDPFGGGEAKPEMPEKPKPKPADDPFG